MREQSPDLHRGWSRNGVKTKSRRTLVWTGLVFGGQVTAQTAGVPASRGPPASPSLPAGRIRSQSRLGPEPIQFLLQTVGCLGAAAETQPLAKSKSVKNLADLNRQT